MKNGTNHLSHIINCFNAYGFFTYQCKDLFQTQIHFLAIHNNISLGGYVIETERKEFDLKKDISKEQLKVLKQINDKMNSGVVVFSNNTQCYYRLSTDLLNRAIEMGIRIIDFNSATLFSKALDTWRKNVNGRNENL